MADTPEQALPTSESIEKSLYDSAMASSEPEQPEQPPAVVESPPAEEPPKAEPTRPAPEEHIPPWRLREESEARRVAEERARHVEGQLAQMQAFIQSQQKQPDFFENPDQSTRALVQQALAPHAEEVRRNLMYMGRMIASQAHGADKVETAEQSFLSDMRDGKLDPADYERVVTSPNRYDAVVQWHKRQSVLSSVGDDPNAWFEKQLEARMADPSFQAKVMEKARQGAAGRPSVVNLPPSLSKVTAAVPNGGEALGDMSDQSLFAFAMKR